MKSVWKIIYFTVAVALFAGCADETALETVPDTTDNAAEETATDSSSTDSEDEKDTEESGSGEDATSEEASGSGLDAYSSEEIEYARVWLQLGPNQDIDGLYVKKIPLGTPLNPDDETSAEYPEDVIQLAGSRLVDGSVTYSGNGDGTVNVYKVPLRWDGEYPAGEDFYKSLIVDTELVTIDVGEDEEVIRLIELLEIED
ncbi:hypothetical protein [Planococcus sp. CAU13]|uniref:hypothetical protein n=1 Tax=Planococcus sp. CAU13 TaxID=1541197 RepID=UPI00052FF148|nr:hypothetical protein [Planococcus sp. CAU13]